MSHLGVLPYKSTGHLNPMVALSRRLMDRGHRVTFFQRPEVEAQIRELKMEFIPIGGSTFASESSNGAVAGSSISTRGALRARISKIAADTDMFLRQGPAVLASARVDALIVDEISLYGPTLAEALRLPYFVISTSLPHVFGWPAPRRFLPRRTLLDRIQNELLQVSAFRINGPLRRSLDRTRRQMGLGPVRQMQKAFPVEAHITQLPECVDFPRSIRQRNFHYTGPFVNNDVRRQIEFPWDCLDTRPLIYISLGTTRTGEPATFHMAAAACHELGLQLVISLGGRRPPEMFAELPGKTIVMQEVPQLDLIKRSDAVITHGGLNTVLETLLEGKPMLVIPKSFDQPAIAARLERLGVAEVLRADRLSAKAVCSALSRLLNDPAYRRAARNLGDTILAAHGLDRATAIIDDLLAKRPGATYADCQHD